MKMKKMWRSRKALSPVIAAIILIAVTVAVSIAVAAWMGALTFTFTKTENLKLPVSVTWGTSPSKNITLTITNMGTSVLVINDIKVNDVSQTNANLDPDKPFSINAGTDQDMEIVYTWTAGNSYRVEFVTSGGNSFFKEYTAPV